MIRLGCLFALVIATFGQVGCSNSTNERDADHETARGDAIFVYTVNYPLKYFAERIGGEHVEVSFPAPPDEDPASWMPTPETIAAYQQADLILLNGATYAKWVDKASLPGSKLCDTSSSFASEYIEIKGAVTHSHGPEGEHAHGEIAFTTWLDPKLAIEQARVIRSALSQRWPGHEPQFEANFTRLEKELAGLDRSIERAVAGVADTPIVFSHPVYQYFQRRFNMNGKSVHWEPDETPSAEQWAELDELLTVHRAKWMIWEAEPKQETVDRLREMGIESVIFDPCGNTPEGGDYLAVMNENARGLMESTGAVARSDTGN